MAGGRLLFLEFLRINPDSNTPQTVSNSSIAVLKAGLSFTLELNLCQTDQAE
jgi:hypothetical protein